MLWRIVLLLLVVTNLYANSYLEKALNDKVYKNKNWKNLLHIVDQKSEVLDESFFLSPQQTAKSELISALQLVNDKNTVCSFPARYSWLKNKLNIPNSIIDISKCAKVTKFINELNTSNVSLVFTSAFFSAPGTMFGHSFIHLNHKSGNKLLGYSINYAAIIPENENIFKYVYKGFSGKYVANYSVDHYYEKIKEYSDLEQRDMWEYELNLNTSQRQQLLYHIYELEDKTKQYTYAKMNCAYNLLWLIEVAKNESFDKDNFSYLPADIIQIFNDKKLINSSSLIPSIQSKIVQNIKLLSNDELTQIIIDISYSKVSVEDFMNKNESTSDKQLVLSTSILYMQYLVAVGELENEDYQAIFLNILKIRSKLGKNTNKKDYAFISNSLNAHKSHKISIESGLKEEDFTSLITYRSGYQGLNDSSNGFIKGSELVYFETKVEVKEDDIELNEFVLLSLSSLSPRSDLFKPISWQAGLKLDRDYIEDDKLYGHFYFGAGLTYDTDIGYSYILLNTHVFHKSDTPSAISSKYGLIFNKDKNTLHFNIEAFHYFNNKEQLVINLQYNYSFTKDLALKAKIKSLQRDDYTEHTYTLGLSYYF